MSKGNKTRSQRARRRSSDQNDLPSRARNRLLWPVTLGILVVGVGINIAILSGTRGGARRSAPTAPTAATDHGRQLYENACAICHGIEGAGYAQSGVPAPALDATEHAWHHADAQILGLMRNGGSTMPAVGAAWTDADRAAVLTYVKTWWTPEQRRAQQGTVGE